MTSAADDESKTPLMKQYWDLKSQAGEDTLLLFRMGDFYELFGDDAVEAARILEITLTSRDKNKPNPVPMAGVPHHSVQGYIQKLLAAGKKVAIGEQMEDPSALKPGGKQIVRREIVRLFTPGVQFDSEGSQANYLATVVPLTNDPRKAVLACLDASTGEALLSEPIAVSALGTELESLAIRHLVHTGGITLPLLGDSVLVEELPSNYLSKAHGLEILKAHYELAQLGSFFGAPAHEDAGILALGTLVTYVARTQKRERLAHLRLPTPLHQPRSLVLGPRTVQHLDLLPQPGESAASPNLFQMINRTRSALGARQLRQWLLSPLKSATEIGVRQAAIYELFCAPHGLCDKLGESLAQVYDLARISARVNTQLANPRDTLAIGRSLATLGPLSSLLADRQSALLKGLQKRLVELAAQLDPLTQEILRTQRDDAPLTVREGGIFNEGTSAELDHLLSLNTNGQKWLIELETRERETTGIPSLKVRYNRVFGYYIEITQAHLKNAPAHYQRKQTTVGAERFFTEELKKFEDEIINASTRQKALEQELFDRLLQSIQSQTQAIMAAAELLGEIDALISLALLLGERGWCLPKIDESLDLVIEQGRHPLVDSATRGSFVPNDLKLSPESHLSLVITGPNMGGKSTVMRQSALIVILGQMGAPVPAVQARWGAISSIYTRIGAHDAIAKGQSTFMVEMSELAHILHHADARSLIVLDEIGRGTSTYDGISVAWSTLEWICTRIQARTLFATHYHELTHLTSSLPLLGNAHMAVEGTRSLQGGTLRFLYKLKDGPTNESFGIHVARIAGLPKPVIERAWKVLEELERNSTTPLNPVVPGQLSLFSGEEPSQSESNVEESLAVPEPEPEPHPVLQALESANLNEMTPIQALNFTVKLQEKCRESAPKYASGPNPPPLPAK